MGQLHARGGLGRGLDVGRKDFAQAGPVFERRHSFRVHVPARASVWSKGELRGSYEVWDLSIGGCLLQGPTQRPLGEQVDVMLHLPHRTALALSARVCRSSEGLLGLAFEAPTPRAEDCIQELVFEAIASKFDPSLRKIALVIEPRHQTRIEILRALRDLGQRAIGVATALDAVQLLVEENEVIGSTFIEISDEMLPSVELIEFFAHNHPRVRRVLVGEPKDIAAAWIAEATGEVDGMLETPVRPEALHRLLTRLGCTLRDAYVS